MKSKIITVVVLAIILIVVGYIVYQRLNSVNNAIVPGENNQQQIEQQSAELTQEERAATEWVPTYMDINPMEALMKIDNEPNLVVVDVSPHYAKGHLPGAINYYVGDGSLDKAIPTLDKNKEYLVYCHVDSASISGAQKLIDAGFRTVYRLQGNYAAWVDAGYPVEK